MDRTTRSMQSARAVLVAVAVVVAFVGAPAARAHHRPGPCGLHYMKGETVRHHSKALIRCATARWSVRGGPAKAICIARRESGLDPTAASATGMYLGLFQHYKPEWPGRYDTWTRPAWQLKETALNGRTNTIVSIRIAHDVGWRPWRGTGC